MGVEAKTVIKPTDEPKTIWVVGGGPGGMEAARVAALRGHRVTLFERRDKLGGQLLFAALAPHKGEWRNLVTYLETQLGKNGVEVKLATKLSADDIVSGRPDELIVATGARPIVPKVPGIDGPNVSSCVDILTGKSQPGQKVAIIGGGCTGGETAEHLAKLGKAVTIIEMLPDVAADVDFWNRWVLLDRLERARIRMIVNAKADEITSAGVRITVDGRSELIEADFVGFAVGARPYAPLLKELEGRFDAVHPIGDCHTPQRVRQAIDAGFRIGLEI
jgi:NADPH-dependent 2,4-dienoyl-CoA reductase/sulfur reductase-like enzyme